LKKITEGFAESFPVKKFIERCKKGVFFRLSNIFKNYCSHAERTDFKFISLSRNIS
jgi:hypothetical protein